ncbi:50S ribosomal protein L11 methyltransferase [Halovulum dunhuangense]|uniref:Ribosomal protein L11 methyltransferase n=1 Tax=Halovulum dunhuangense TaxID=1505036 RepID=A0A849L509_9RHOB|nr:50S ribosomal protein L11 methyltransferase [Halovulum dunhuangense]NNU81272.1 50S ribosomal protein L11 methyltransferase [Halovulum dunhuangense]
MTTWTALTSLPGEDRAAALADAIDEMTPSPTGVGIFEIEDGSGLWEVGGYFTQKPDVAALDLMAAMHGARPFAVSRVEDRDWVAQVRRELTPVEAGRFVVFGSHDRDTIPENRIGLEIEAAMAFGTGHHGTTRGCLLALDRLMRQGMVAGNTADIGCGTGVLAMAARRAFKRDVIASDIDPVAVATAVANMHANRIGAAVPVVCGAGFRNPALRTRAPYDLVFANILARPLVQLAPDMARHIRPGGVAILSGILNRQARRVEGVYAGHGFSRIDRINLGEWVTLVLRRG